MHGHVYIPSDPPAPEDPAALRQVRELAEADLQRWRFVARRLRILRLPADHRLVIRVDAVLRQLLLARDHADRRSALAAPSAAPRPTRGPA